MVNELNMIDLAKANPKAALLLQHLNRFGRSRKTTNITRLVSQMQAKGNAITLEEVENILGKFQEADCGKIINFKGDKPKFTWSTNFRTLSKNVLSHIGKLSPVRPERRKRIEPTASIVIKKGDIVIENLDVESALDLLRKM